MNMSRQIQFNNSTVDFDFDRPIKDVVQMLRVECLYAINGQGEILYEGRPLSEGDASNGDTHTPRLSDYPDVAVLIAFREGIDVLSGNGRKAGSSRPFYELTAACTEHLVDYNGAQHKMIFVANFLRDYAVRKRVRYFHTCKGEKYPILQDHLVSKMVNRIEQKFRDIRRISRNTQAVAATDAAATDVNVDVGLAANVDAAAIANALPVPLQEVNTESAETNQWLDVHPVHTTLISPDHSAPDYGDSLISSDDGDAIMEVEVDNTEDLFAPAPLLDDLPISLDDTVMAPADFDVRNVFDSTFHVTFTDEVNAESAETNQWLDVHPVHTTLISQDHSESDDLLLDLLLDSDDNTEDLFAPAPLLGDLPISLDDTVMAAADLRSETVNDGGSPGRQVSQVPLLPSLDDLSELGDVMDNTESAENQLGINSPPPLPLFPSQDHSDGLSELGDPMDVCIH